MTFLKDTCKTAVFKNDTQHNLKKNGSQMHSKFLINKIKRSKNVTLYLKNVNDQFRYILIAPYWHISKMF